MVWPYRLLWWEFSIRSHVCSSRTTAVWSNLVAISNVQVCVSLCGSWMSFDGGDDAAETTLIWLLRQLFLLASCVWSIVVLLFGMWILWDLHEYFLVPETSRNSSCAAISMSRWYVWDEAMEDSRRLNTFFFCISGFLVMFCSSAKKDNSFVHLCKTF
jgi:hypothetical protein